MLATQALYVLRLVSLTWIGFWGFVSRLQEAHCHNPTNSNLFPYAHLQRHDPRKRDQENDEIIQHIDNPQREKELVNIDTLPLGAAKLVPEI